MALSLGSTTPSCAHVATVARCSGFGSCSFPRAEWTISARCGSCEPAYCDETHDPARRSWVDRPKGRTRLPDPEPAFGIFRRRRRQGRARASAWRSATQCSTSPPATTRAGSPAPPTARGRALRSPALNALMALGRRHWTAFGAQASTAARAPTRRPAASARAATASLVRRSDAELLLPAAIGDYTDFYASVHHATNVGQHVPAGQSAAAQLQVGADRLSRPRVVDRAERHAGAAAERADQGPKRRRPAFAPSRASTTRWRSGFFVGPGQSARRAGPDRRGASRTCSASASSTTGRRATCRAGSTSRSGPSSPRTSRRRSRPGS